MAFFWGSGLNYLAALAVDWEAARWRLPGAAAILPLGLAIATPLLSSVQTR